MKIVFPIRISIPVNRILAPVCRELATDIFRFFMKNLEINTSLGGQRQVGFSIYCINSIHVVTVEHTQDRHTLVVAMLCCSAV